MSYEEHVYSVLIVSSSEKMNESLKSVLPKSNYDPVMYVSSISAAKRAVLENTFDFVIVNSPLQDDVGTRFVIDVCNNRNTVCLFMVKSDNYEELHYRVVNSGVFTLRKPTNSSIMTQGLDWMVATRERLRKLDKKTLTLEEKMEEIRIVNRAKWILIEDLKMAEADAHRFIEKQAMDKCVSKREVAETIIKTYR